MYLKQRNVKNTHANNVDTTFLAFFNRKNGQNNHSFPPKNPFLFHQHFFRLFSTLNNICATDLTNSQLRKIMLVPKLGQENSATNLIGWEVIPDPAEYQQNDLLPATAFKNNTSARQNSWIVKSKVLLFCDLSKQNSQKIKWSKGQRVRNFVNNSSQKISMVGEWLGHLRSAQYISTKIWAWKHTVTAALC